MDYKIIAFIGLVYLTLTSAESYLKEQPSYIPPCKIYEPEFTKCSTNSVQKLFTQLAEGIPGLKGIGPIDPFSIKKVQYKQDNNQVATISANLTDLEVKGFSKTIVKQSKVSKKDFSWETHLLIPKLRMDGKYNMVGKILVVPLSGSGNMFIEIENVNIKAFTTTRLYEKGGFTFYNVTAVRIELDVSNLQTKFENLFSQNKEIEKSTIDFFNKNWKDVFEAFRPLITQTVEDILLSVMQKIFHYIPANFLVSDIPTPEKLYGKM